MLEFIDGADDIVADDIVAMTVSDRLTGADLTAMMDRIERAMADHDTIHVFVETRSLEGIQVSGLGAHVARAIHEKLDDPGHRRCVDARVSCSGQRRFRQAGRCFQPARSFRQC